MVIKNFFIIKVKVIDFTTNLNWMALGDALRTAVVIGKKKRQ